jgi:hypothetical protein
MRTRLAGLFLLACLFLAGCQSPPACPPASGTPEFLQAPLPTAPPTHVLSQTLAPVAVEIGGRSVLVDQVVRGPLCNGTWSGTVYVTCDVQVLPWEDQPTFLQGCELSIAPDTVVYVAGHHDAAYYNGCSCHTGEAGGT